jgi:hypothetical protein
LKRERICTQQKEVGKVQIQQIVLHICCQREIAVDFEGSKHQRKTVLKDKLLEGPSK